MYSSKSTLQYFSGTFARNYFINTIFARNFLIKKCEVQNYLIDNFLLPQIQNIMKSFLSGLSQISLYASIFGMIPLLLYLLVLREFLTLSLLTKILNYLYPIKSSLLVLSHLLFNKITFDNHTTYILKIHVQPSVEINLDGGNKYFLRHIGSSIRIPIG